MTSRCEAASDRLGAALDGEAPVDAQSVEHVAGCASCRDWLRAAERLQTASLLARATPVPPVARPATLAWRRRHARLGIERSLGRALLVVAAVAQAGLAVALLLMLTGHVVADLAALQVALAAVFLAGAMRPQSSVRVLLPVALVSVGAALLEPTGPAPAAAHALLEAQHLPALAALLGLLLAAELPSRHRRASRAEA